MSTAPAATRRFGKCTTKGCKVRVVVDATTATITAHPHMHGIEDITLTPGVHGDLTVSSKGLAFCTAHRSLIAWAPVKATVVLTMDCGPQCHNAKTDKCKCSCGGAEHGRFA